MLSLTINPLSANNGSAQNGSFFSDSDGGPSFKDVLDVLNPLQHIPIVSTIYHALTGDTESSGASLVGGALYGGPLGFAGALISQVVETQTGKGIGGNILTMLQGTNTASLADASSYGPSDGVPLSANQRFAYNAYLHTQNLPA